AISANADWDATTIVVAGRDRFGREISETFNVPDGGDTTLTGTKVFASITTVTIAAQSGAAGTFTMGVGTTFANAALDVTATDGATYVDVAADTAGDWFAFQDPTSNLALEDRTAEPATTLATDLAAIRAADADWYHLIVSDAQSKVQIEAAAAWMETQVGMYFPHSFDAAPATSAEDDVLSSLEGFSYLRTKAIYSKRNAGRGPAGAAVGMWAPYDPGEADIEFKSIAGLQPDSLSDTEVLRLVGSQQSPAASKRALIYAEVLPTGTNVGTPITYGGLTSGGEWADIIVGLDFLNSLIQERAFNLRISQARLPFTAAGIESLRLAVLGALRFVAAAPYNLLAPDSIVVTATAVSDVSDADKQARYFDGVQWGANVQGAIRALRVRGSVSP
ncbi:MAG: DUF3383 family protein, partial [Acidobacteriota bacterium]